MLCIAAHVDSPVGLQGSEDNMALLATLLLLVAWVFRRPLIRNWRRVLPVGIVVAITGIGAWYIVSLFSGNLTLLLIIVLFLILLATYAQ